VNTALSMYVFSIWVSQATISYVGKLCKYVTYWKLSYIGPQITLCCCDLGMKDLLLYILPCFHV